MELNIKFDEKMLVETANRVLDEFKYNGKTIREWADLIANPKTNADRIRAMTDEELAELFKSPLFFNKPWCCLHENPCRHLDSKEFKCAECLLDWLKQEAK